MPDKGPNGPYSRWRSNVGFNCTDGECSWNRHRAAKLLLLSMEKDVTEQSAEETYQRLYGKDRDVLLARLRRIEGQARGISKMIEDDRYCPDIIQQLIAMTSAAREVSLLLLDGHIRGCVTDAIRGGDGEDTIRELIGVVRRAART